MKIASYRSPGALLDELGITEPDWLDLEAIAYACGAVVIRERLRGCEAHLFARDGRAIITVNSDSPPERQRFSIAHELGHWMIDRGKVAAACGQRTYNIGWSNDNPEFRANRYAAELLMPESMFGRHAQNRDMVFGTVRELSETFFTSVTATAIRLVEVGSFPAMLVCHEAGGHRWKWFSRGPDVPEEVRPHDTPDVYTVAYDVLRGAAKMSGPTLVDADTWIDHPRARGRSLLEDSVEVMPGVVLSMLWWKDESMLRDITEAENEY